MLPQMAFTSSLAFVALLLCFSFPVNPQPNIYPTASAPASWTPILAQNFYDSGESVSSLLLRFNASRGMSFGTGLYCFPPCKSFFLSIYIIYATDDVLTSYNMRPQVIWSANRAHPVSENATVQLTSKDGLTLRDSDGSHVWSTSGLNRSVAGINITESGNLVLFDINNSTIWQSFDHPTDCLVMGQTLVGGVKIIANSSSTDLAESQFYLALLADGLYGFFNSNPPMEYYHSHTSNQTDPFYNERSNKTVDKSIFIKFMDGELTMFSKLSNTDMGTIIFKLPPAKSIQYMRLESDGHFRLYDFDYDYKLEWNMVRDLFNTDIDFPKMDNCDYPTVCGHYGICNYGQCTCPTGILGNYIKSVDNRRAELGCYAVTNITCQDENNHHLLYLNNVSYFNLVDNVAFDATDEETCKKACLGDCKCKAALFQLTNGSSSDGRCFTLQEIFSFKKQPDAYSSAYIKVQVAPSMPPTLSPPFTPPPPSSFKVGLGVILGSTFGALLIMLTLIGVYMVCLRTREE